MWDQNSYSIYCLVFSQHSEQSHLNSKFSSSQLSYLLFTKEMKLICFHLLLIAGSLFLQIITTTAPPPLKRISNRSCHTRYLNMENISLEKVIFHLGMPCKSYQNTWVDGFFRKEKNTFDQKSSQWLLIKLSKSFEKYFSLNICVRISYILYLYLSFALLW